MCVFFVFFVFFAQISSNKTQSRKWAVDDNVLKCCTCRKVFGVTVRKVNIQHEQNGVEPDNTATILSRHPFLLHSVSASLP